MNNPPVEIYDPYTPRDDASVADLIAKKYVEAGIDPMSAYDNPDDALGELGLKGQGF